MRLDLGSRASKLLDGKNSNGKPGEPNTAAHPGRREACGHERQWNQEIEPDARGNEQNPKDGWVDHDIGVVGRGLVGVVALPR